MAEMIKKWDVVDKLIHLENEYNFHIWDAQTLYRKLCEVEVEIGKTSGVGWIPVSERLPEIETEVLILARHGNRNVITTGMYEDGRRLTEDSDWWWETEGFEYDEVLDVHIIPEGWWEYKHYIDDETRNYAIDGVVTHWMPLPEPPKEV